MSRLVVAARTCRDAGDWRRAMQHARAAMRAAPDEPAPAFLLCALAIEHGGEAPAPDALYRRFPTYAPGWAELGQVLRRLGRPAEACVALDLALRAQPGFPEAWFVLGLARQDLGEPGPAAAAFAHARERAGDWPEAAVNQGIALQETGRMEAALAAYRAAVRLRPDTLGRVAQAVTSASVGRLWLDPAAFRRFLLG